MRKRSLRQTVWAQTGLKDVGRAALMKYNREVRPFRIRCDATRKRDGERCENIASPNGKCRVHGGATPRGDEWHKPQWPSGSRPDWQKKLHEKLARLDRDQKRLERRLARMTANERERYDRWVKAHKPGPAHERVSRRADKKAAADFQTIAEQPAPVSPELGALRAKHDALVALRNRLLSEFGLDDNKGVFS